MLFKKYFLLILLMFFFSGVKSQVISDSLRYYAMLYNNKELTSEQRKVYGKKIRDFQLSQHRESQKHIKNNALKLQIIQSETHLKSLEIEVLAQELMALACDSSNNNILRFESLKTLSTMNLSLSDSFLVSNIDGFNYLKAFESAGEEIESMFPCYSLLIEKSQNNYNLLQPIIKNLNVLQSQRKVNLISDVLSQIFLKDILYQFLNFQLGLNPDNPIFTRNVEFILNK